MHALASSGVMDVPAILVPDGPLFDASQWLRAVPLRCSVVGCDGLVRFLVRELIPRVLDSVAAALHHARAIALACT
jgi:hypothetical protein